MDYRGRVQAGPSRRRAVGHAPKAGSSTTKRAPAPWRVGSSGLSSSIAAGGAPRSRGAVVRPNPPAMRLDDLAGNRQPEARVLTEALARAIGIKSLENALKRMRRDPGAVIIDGNDDAVARRRPLGFGSNERAFKRDAHDAARFGERARVVNQIGHDLREAKIMPEHEIVGAGVLSPPNGDGQFDPRAIASRRILSHRHNRA